MFTKFIGLDTSIAKRWVPRAEGGMLIVDLKEPSQTVASNRRKSNIEGSDSGTDG